MTKERNYDIGDYVRYNGRFGSSIAKITETRISFEREVPVLYLFDQNTEIIGDYNDVRPILTNEKHLIALGFNRHDDDGKVHFTLNNIVVGEISIAYSDMQTQLGVSYIFCGFRAKLGQITKEEIIKTLGDKYDEITFSSVFAPATFLMQLFEFLDKNEIQYNKESIALTK